MRCCAALMVFAGLAPACLQAAEGYRETPDNRGVVQLVAGTGSGIAVRMAEELAGVVDDGATRRLLPVVGKGALQNITDLRMLRGIDLAIVQSDAVEQLRGRDGGITYIAKLYNEEFHLL